MDGAGEWRCFFASGSRWDHQDTLGACAGVLDCWNMVEQPLAFLRDKSLWPLSLYLPEVDVSRAGLAFAASVITLIPAVFVFVMGQEYLEQGIVAAGIKE